MTSLTRQRVWEQSTGRDEEALPGNDRAWRVRSKHISLCQVCCAQQTGQNLTLNIIRFFDAWRAGDYHSSFDNLHRYFDYTMSMRDKTYYQYALLHMAVLQADFGCFSEAYAAMQETIATARENQDMNCLNFSLSWLHHLSKAYPRQMRDAGYKGITGSEREGLEFLEAKAKEGRSWSLLSSTLLSLTKLTLSNVCAIYTGLGVLFHN